jgi:hypothetical protein
MTTPHGLAKMRCGTRGVQDIALMHQLGVHLVLVVGSSHQIDEKLRKGGMESRFVGEYRVTDPVAMQVTRRVTRVHTANRDVRDFGWEIAHGAVTRRPPSLRLALPSRQGCLGWLGVSCPHAQLGTPPWGCHQLPWHLLKAIWARRWRWSPRGRTP